ncbi:AAA family ATPase [Cobetia sp. MB87]|nr:AAA family ATPase [Cobetia sp. MB87]NHH85880.1 hypothetical protein [Cobetia sp. MB87]
MITEFFVLGLYEERNVRITFEDNCKVIVAENGYGKTTILNMLYSLLSGDTSKLRKVVFDSVGVTFRDGETISISKDELAIDHSGILNDTEYGFIELIGDDVLDALIEEERLSTLYNGYSNYSSGHRSSLFRSVVHKYDVSPARLRRYLRSFMAARKEEELKSPVQVKLARVKEKFGYESLHLPTYRRVEEKAGYLPGLMSEELLDQSSINFGMSDVKKNIHDITSEIKNSSVEWFSKINGQMLSQLVDGFSVTDEMKDQVVSADEVSIVLERIGDNISEAHKVNILELVGSGEIRSGHDPLVYFLCNLLTVYKQQQDNDVALQMFAKISNKYLVDKEIVYDESKVTVDVVRKKSRKLVDIESLSSGEKQILSLFAILYLRKNTDIAIFFDEPELSLSIEWQRLLLPDIIDSGTCAFLFATTHSPFIFDNSLESCTVDLAEYIQEL